MSQQNLEVAVKQFEGTSARDFAGVMDTWAEDVTLIVHWQAGQLSDRATGKAAVGECGSGTGSGSSAWTTGSTSRKRTTPVTVCSSL